ncbi:MAG: hypothetical protein ABJA80_08230 [bacterium]
MLARRCLASPAIRATLVALLACAGMSRPARAVTVSPTALYITSRSPSALLTLYNAGDRPEEIEISFGFGYPRSDSTGTLQVIITDSAATGEPSASAWLRVFPRRMILQPGQRQVVRVTVVAPAGIADGEYWGRVLVKSRGGEPPIEQAQGQVKMSLTVETTFATAVFFRKGDNTTGITVPTAAAVLTPRGVQTTLDLERTGSSAYLGRVRVFLVDSVGRTRDSVEDVVAVYRQLRRRFAMPLPPGTRPSERLFIRYVIDDERPDLPPGGKLPSPPATAIVPVRQ